MMRRLVALGLAVALAVAPAQANFSRPGVLSLLGSNLADFQIGPAATQTGAPVLNLSGLTAISCQVRFFYGSGGTQTNVFIQTSLDQGLTFFDLANIQFTTSSDVRVINLSGLDKLTTPTVPTNLTLAAGTVLDGPIGDRLQAVVVSQGIYGGGTLVSVRCAAR